MKKHKNTKKNGGLTPNKLDEKTGEKGDKLAEKNRKEIAKMNKKLQKILKNDTKKNKNANKKLIKHASSHLKI